MLRFLFIIFIRFGKIPAEGKIQQNVVCDCMALKQNWGTFNRWMQDWTSWDLRMTVSCVIFIQKDKLSSESEDSSCVQS